MARRLAMAVALVAGGCAPGATPAPSHRRPPMSTSVPAGPVEAAASATVRDEGAGSLPATTQPPTVPPAPTTTAPPGVVAEQSGATAPPPPVPVSAAPAEAGDAATIDDAFWRRLADCECASGQCSGGHVGYFQFSPDTARKVGIDGSESYDDQRAGAVEWARRIHPNEATRSGWPHCWDEAA